LPPSAAWLLGIHSTDRLMRATIIDARIAHTAQIDLRFGDLAREVLDLRVGVGPGNLARQRFHFLRQCWSGTNGKAERVAKRVSRRASAPLDGLRAGAGQRIRAIGLDLAVAGQAASFPSGPRSLAHSVVALRQETPDADRSRVGWRCGGSRR
jgi:hypothetical protein